MTLASPDFNSWTGRGRLARSSSVRRLLVVCLAVIATPCGAEPGMLSPVDAQLLLERLERLEKGSKERLMERYRAAHAAFRAAAQSDTATHELFLACVEKVRYEDEGKKSQEFREWKRRHK